VALFTLSIPRLFYLTPSFLSVSFPLFLLALRSSNPNGVVLEDLTCAQCDVVTHELYAAMVTTAAGTGRGHGTFISLPHILLFLCTQLNSDEELLPLTHLYSHSLHL